MNKFVKVPIRILKIFSDSAITHWGFRVNCLLIFLESGAPPPQFHIIASSGLFSPPQPPKIGGTPNRGNSCVNFSDVIHYPQILRELLYNLLASVLIDNSSNISPIAREKQNCSRNFHILKITQIFGLRRIIKFYPDPR